MHVFVLIVGPGTCVASLFSSIHKKYKTFGLSRSEFEPPISQSPSGRSILQATALVGVFINLRVSVVSQYVFSSSSQPSDAPYMVMALRQAPVRVIQHASTQPRDSRRFRKINSIYVYIQALYIQNQVQCMYLKYGTTKILN